MDEGGTAMHELSLCRSIVGIVERASEGRRVRTVGLQVGHLRQVVPETLRFCWGLVTEAGPLAGSVLAIDHIPVRLACNDCSAETLIEQVLVLTCGQCGSGQITLLTGEELLVTSVDLELIETTTQPEET